MRCSRVHVDLHYERAGVRASSVEKGRESKRGEWRRIRAEGRE